MSESDQPAGLPIPRAIGRVVRLVAAVLLIYFVTELVLHTRQFLAQQPGWRVPGGSWWIVAGLALWALPEILNSGFGLGWGKWPRGAFLLVGALTAMWDVLVYKSFWAPPLAVLVYALLVYVCVHMALSLAVAALAATPG